MKKDKKHQPKPEPENVVRIDSLAALQEIIDKPLECPVIINGQRVVIPVNRLSPELEDRIEAIRSAPVPPFVQPKRPGEEAHYDAQDSKYLEQKAKAEKSARAMTVYFGCKAIHEAKPGLTSVEEITRFVQGEGANKGILTNMVLELIYMTILGEGLKVEDRRVSEKANFTIAPE